MSGLQWFLVGYFAMNLVLTPLFVGKKRTTITPGAASVTVVIYALLIWAVVAS